jgi:hypothetical protein
MTSTTFVKALVEGTCDVDLGKPKRPCGPLQAQTSFHVFAEAKAHNVMISGRLTQEDRRRAKLRLSPGLLRILNLERHAGQDIS